MSFTPHIPHIALRIGGPSTLQNMKSGGARQEPVAEKWGRTLRSKPVMEAGHPHLRIGTYHFLFKIIFLHDSFPLPSHARSFSPKSSPTLSTEFQLVSTLKKNQRKGKSARNLSMRWCFPWFAAKACISRNIEP